jgi:hypothetical protein
MKGANPTVIASILVALIAGIFWFAGVSPKRDQVTKLDAQVAKLQAEADKQQQAAAVATRAKAQFGGDYQQVVLLGKAVPASDDTASMLVELNRIADKSKVEFRGIELNSAGDAAPAPVAPAPAPAPTDGSTTPSDGSTATTDSSTTATPVASTVPATESAAATLPIGATIGDAGLGVMPYSLTFRGGFFGAANFIAGLDRLVHTKTGNVAVDGRLVTIDGFSLVPDDELGLPTLDANFAVTTYVTPAGQGLTAGATAAAPAAPVTTTTTTAAPVSP